MKILLKVKIESKTLNWRTGGNARSVNGCVSLLSNSISISRNFLPKAWRRERRDPKLENPRL